MLLGRSMRFTRLGIWSLCLLAVALCRAPIQANAAQPVHLGALIGTIDHYWRPAPPGPSDPVCIQPAPVVCDFFRHRDLHIIVGFVYSRAVSFAIGGYRHPERRQYWNFLVSLLPRGAKRTSCTTVHTPEEAGASGTGRAHACLYRYRGHTVLVAQHVVPIRLAIEGEVRLNASFKDVGSVP